MRTLIINIICRISISLFFVSLFFVSYNLSAKNVEFVTAQKVAYNVFSEKAGRSKSSIQIKEAISVKWGEETVYYIFNFYPNGFIIISAEDASKPVLGYGLDTNFNFSDVPPELVFLLEGYKNEIAIIKEKKLKADDAITKEWEYYSSDDYISLKSYSIDTYLLETTWNQNYPYNQFCPIDPNVSLRCPAGCGAVALGQVLHYWDCKVFPDSSMTYIPMGFTNSLTVNFYDQGYDWNSMSHSSGDVENAKLLYHCGVAIRTDYSVDDGSSSYPSDIEYALENYFGFGTDGLFFKSSYSDNDWINMLKTDIDASRPVIIAGVDQTQLGHIWVVDGYNSSNQFHCNWGWSGYLNTFFTLSQLNPDGHNYALPTLEAILGINPILDACLGLSGNNAICSSNTSYSVTIPATASVVWSKSGNLAEVGGNTGSTYTVYATSDSGAAGAITATIKNSQGSTFMTRTKNIWTGRPSFTLSGSDLLTPLERGMVTVDYSSNDMSIDPYSYSWTYSGPLSSFTGDYTKANYRASSQTGQGYIYFSIENPCGVTENQMYYQVVDQYLMSISPNPATEYVELTFTLLTETSDVTGRTKIDNKIYSLNDGLGCYQVQLWSEKGGLLKDMQSEQTKLNISTRDLPNGQYFIHLIKDGKTYKKQLLIQR
jgi:hypothetical protein